MSSSLRLVPVTSDNVEAACSLSVRPDQSELVQPVAWSLAQAYTTPDIAWPRLIVDGETLVGFVMAFINVQFAPGTPDDPFRSGLWRLNIDSGQQGRGYGRFAVEAVSDELRGRGARGRPSRTCPVRTVPRSSTGSSVSVPPVS